MALWLARLTVSVCFRGAYVLEWARRQGSKASEVCCLAKAEFPLLRFELTSSAVLAWNIYLDKRDNEVPAVNEHRARRVPGGIDPCIYTYIHSFVQD